MFIKHLQLMWVQTQEHVASVLCCGKRSSSHSLTSGSTWPRYLNILSHYWKIQSNGDIHSVTKCRMLLKKPYGSSMEADMMHQIPVKMANKDKNYVFTVSMSIYFTVLGFLWNNTALSCTVYGTCSLGHT
jgi:hypothetical protein